uniref:Uncharacterized protein n=1 Tax=Arundo donax TaxID=35708 RepID=A0A0A9BE70_ARUDO
MSPAPAVAPARGVAARGALRGGAVGPPGRAQRPGAVDGRGAVLRGALRPRRADEARGSTRLVAARSRRHDALRDACIVAWCTAARNSLLCFWNSNHADVTDSLRITIDSLLA